MKKYDIDTGSYGNGYCTEEDEFGLFVYADDAEDEIARLTRERDEAVRVAVWAARHCEGLSGSDRLFLLFELSHESDPIAIEVDGTDADIYRALREAMGASEGGGDGD